MITTFTKIHNNLEVNNILVHSPITEFPPSNKSAPPFHPLSITRLNLTNFSMDNQLSKNKYKISRILKVQIFLSNCKKTFFILIKFVP